MTLTRVLARPLLSSVFFVGATNAFQNADKVAPAAAKVTDKVVPALRQTGLPVTDNTALLVKANAATQMVAAAGLATGTAPRACATVLAVSLIPTTLAGHAFWGDQDPATKRQQLLQFAKNASVLGGLLLAAVDTDGRPGLAWRAGRAADDLGRETRRLRKQAALEAKLAQARLT